MKSRMLTLLISIAAPAHAQKLFCFESKTHEWVRLDTQFKKPSLRYGRFDQELLSIDLPKGAFRQSGRGRIVVLATPRAGENIIDFYGRIKGNRALFDIYRFGMDGALDSTSSNYKCRRI